MQINSVGGQFYTREMVDKVPLNSITKQKTTKFNQLFISLG